MKAHYIAIITTLLFTTTSYAYVEELEIRSKGDVYYLGFIKVYDAFLLSDPEVDTSRILEPTISKCLKLNYDVALTPENFIEGANQVLGRQHSPEVLSALKTEIDLLHENYLPVSEGDIYTLCYDADTVTTSLSLNGKNLVSIASPQFSSIYFGIWLSPDQPISKKLQRSLLKQ